MTVILFTDGGSRGNPGPAAIGGVVYDEKKNVLATVSQYIGETTNNQAEYRALLETLQVALDLGATDLRCYLDSELVVKQMRREYKIKDPGLAKLFVEILHLIENVSHIQFQHVPRAQNTEADRLVNQALDAHLKKL